MRIILPFAVSYWVARRLTRLGKPVFFRFQRVLVARYMYTYVLCNFIISEERVLLRRVRIGAARRRDMFHNDGRGRSAGRAAFAAEVAGGDILRPHMDRARWPSAGLAASGVAGGDRRFHIDAPAPRRAARGFSIAGGLTQPQTG